MEDPQQDQVSEEMIGDAEKVKSVLEEVASAGAATKICADEVALGDESDPASIFRSCVAHEELLRRVMAMAPCDLTRTEMSIVVTLNAVGPLAMTPLSQCIAVSKEQASRAVKPLVARGYVERRHSEENRRIVVVQLTDEGTAFLDGLMERALSSLEELIEPLSDEERSRLVGCSDESGELINKALEPKRNLYSIGKTHGE